jgi:hypothetical protein
LINRDLLFRRKKELENSDKVLNLQVLAVDGVKGVSHFMRNRGVHLFKGLLLAVQPLELDAHRDVDDLEAVHHVSVRLVFVVLELEVLLLFCF